MTNDTDRPEPREAVARLYEERYPSARVLFCGGSVVRGEGLSLSDLDVVVLFDRIDNAWRESFHFAGWPVEVFAHDPETLTYFVKQDVQSGRPSLAQMISEALIVPGGDAWSEAIQRWARIIVASPPPSPSAVSLHDDRYWITDLVDDFRDDRSESELRAIAYRLYPMVVNFILKTRGSWLGAGKTLPRLLARTAPDLGQDLEEGFALFFRTGERGDVITVIERAMKPFGGMCFDGFRSDAPSAARSTEIPWMGESQATE